MKINIDIQGPRACGKTHLAQRLSEFLDQELLPSQRGVICIRTGGIDEHWTIERESLH